MQKHHVSGLAILHAALAGAGVVLAAPDQPIEESIAVTTSYAQSGDPSAQFNLALRYQKGEGVAKDPKLSEQWYRRGAESGFAPAQFNLAVMNASGIDLPKNEKEAAKWLYMAAQQGVFDAQRILGRFYAEGLGVEKSPAKALAWDFIARRTLELRHEQPAGEPPHPAKLRSDGAAEIVLPDGSRRIMQADGGEESSGSDGKRVLNYPDGRRKEIYADGMEFTRNARGFEETKFPDGRIKRTDPNGTSETTFPDGRKEMEGDGTDSAGRKVRITEMLDKEGKRTGRRIVRGDRTVFENESRAYLVETIFKDSNGVEVKLRETVSPEGKIGNGKLTRTSDGEAPKPGEYWTIERRIEPGKGRVVFVKETYDSGGLAKQEVLKNVMEAPAITAIPQKTIPVSVPAMPAAPEQVFTMPATPATPVMFVGGSQPRVNVFKEKTDIKPMLKELEELEAVARNFAGATENDWTQSKAAAQRFTIPLINPPQKPGATPNWITLRTLTQNALPEAMLKTSADDGSTQVPFGHHGSTLIKQQPWRHSQTVHFIVHYLDEADARLTMQYIEGAHAVVRNLLGLDPARGAKKCHVFLFPDRASWDRFLASTGNTSSRLAGFAYKNELLLPVETVRTKKDSAIKTLCHEATHAIVHVFYPGQKPPLWLNEGFAEYVASRTLAIKNGGSIDGKIQGRMGRKAVQQPSSGAAAVINVADLFRRIHYGIPSQAGAPFGAATDSLGTFYPDSEKCVSVLCEKLPISGFAVFFNTLLAGNPPHTAFSLAYGVKCPNAQAFSTMVNGR